MRTGYVICTTPRSGSTLLCTLLEATGRSGRPDSFYHAPHFMQEWAEAWGLPDPTAVSKAAYDAAYLRAVKAAGRGGTDVFGMRLQQAYLSALVTTLAGLYPDATSDAERFSRAFGELRYVHLTRADKVTQAISLVKAQQSGLWHRNVDGSERERTAPAAAPSYDRVAIETEIARLTDADEAWRAWFAREAIEPIRLEYEIFARQPAASVRALCTLLGNPMPDDMPLEPGVARLSDAINAEWTALYRATLSGSDEPLRG